MPNYILFFWILIGFKIRTYSNSITYRVTKSPHHKPLLSYVEPGFTGLSFFYEHLWGKFTTLLCHFPNTTSSIISSSATKVLYFCVGFWLLVYLTRDLCTYLKLFLDINPKYSNLKLIFDINPKLY